MTRIRPDPPRPPANSTCPSWCSWCGDSNSTCPSSSPLAERCASGEIKSVRELEVKISQLKASIPVPTFKFASKGKKITATDVEAQVEPDEKAKLPTDTGGYGRNFQQQPIDRERIRKCGSEKIRQALDEDKSPWFRSPDDCRLCAEVTLDIWVRSIAELIVFKGLPVALARAEAEKEYALDPDQIGRGLRIKLNRFLGEALNTGSWPKGPAWVGEVKHPIWDMTTTCQLSELFALVNFAVGGSPPWGHRSSPDR